METSVPDSVQDAGDWDKNLHSSEDWDSRVCLATDRKTERKRKKEEDEEQRWRYRKPGGQKRHKTKNSVTMLVHLFIKLNIRKRGTGHSDINTQTPRSCLCGWVRCQSKREHPLGCKSSKLLV